MRTLHIKTFTLKRKNAKLQVQITNVIYKPPRTQQPHENMKPHVHPTQHTSNNFKSISLSFSLTVCLEPPREGQLNAVIFSQEACPWVLFLSGKCCLLLSFHNLLNISRERPQEKFMGHFFAFRIFEFAFWELIRVEIIKYLCQHECLDSFYYHCHKPVWRRASLIKYSSQMSCI